MNMKKKSLVAGLLAVSLAAQPVAATIAPKAVHAETNEGTPAVAEVKEPTKESIKNVNGYIEGVKYVVDTYKSKGMEAVGASIALLEEQFPKFSTLQQSIIKAEKEYATYELIVKEWKDSINLSDEELLEAEKLALEIIKEAKIKVEDGKIIKEEVSLTRSQADKIYNLIRDNKYAGKAFDYVGKDKDGKPAFNKDKEFTVNIEDVLKKDAAVNKIIADRKVEIEKLGVGATLEEAVKYIEDYNAEAKELKVYGKDVYTEDVAKAIVRLEETEEGEDNKVTLKKGIVGRIDDILSIKVPSINSDLNKVMKGENVNETARLSELNKAKESFDKLPELVKNTLAEDKKQPKVLYYTGDKIEEEPVVLKNLKSIKDNVKAINTRIETLEESVKDFEKRANELLAKEKPSKAAALSLLGELTEVKGEKVVSLASEFVDKDIVAKLNAIVEGKPVAPVKETYYSLGVNVRDAEDNLLGRLDRGFVIENAVLKEDNYIHFTYEGKEARAHINFVSKEKPLDAFYSKGGNVRETPDTKGLKLGYLPVNQIVLGEVTEDGVWVEIEFNGRKAFIANNRLSKEAVEVRYTSVGANVRNAAGEKVGYYKAGEVFKGVKEGNRIKVDYKGAVGYVHVAFVK